MFEWRCKNRLHAGHKVQSVEGNINYQVSCLFFIAKALREVDQASNSGVDCHSRLIHQSFIASHHIFHISFVHPCLTHWILSQEAMPEKEEAPLWHRCAELSEPCRCAGMVRLAGNPSQGQQSSVFFPKRTLLLVS